MVKPKLKSVISLRWSQRKLLWGNETGAECIQVLALTKIQRPNKQRLLYCVLFIPICIRLTFNFHLFFPLNCIIGACESKIECHNERNRSVQLRFKIHSFTNTKTINLILNLRVSFVSLKSRITSRQASSSSLASKESGGWKGSSDARTQQRNSFNITPTPTC